LERLPIARASWAERTSSALSEDRLNLCASRLAALSGVGIYGKSAAQSLSDAYKASYYSVTGERAPALPELRKLVRGQLPHEFPLVSGREESLLQRLLIFEGKTRLFAREETLPALSLVKRLWCAVTLDSEGAFWLKLYKPLIPLILSAASSDGFAEMRRKVFALEATVHSLLYLHGVLYAQPTVTGFMNNVLKDRTPRTRDYVTRCLMAQFDYVYDRQGNMLLVHDGLAEPDRVIPDLTEPLFQDQSFTMQMILGGMNEMLSEEAPAIEALTQVLKGVLQPEYTAAAVANDLKLLAKQGAPLEALSDLIRDKLLTAMPIRLENALRRLVMDTVRWEGAQSARLN